MLNLQSLVAVAHFLARTLGSNRVRDAQKCRSRSYHTRYHPASSGALWHGTVAGVPSNRGGTQTEGRVEQQVQRRQAAAHPILADADSESLQAAIQRLFGSGITVEVSAFRNFVGWLMLVPMLALDGAEEDNIPSANASATSLVTPCTEQFSISGIHISWTLVCYVHLRLSTPIERTVRTVVRRLRRCSPGASLRLGRHHFLSPRSAAAYPPTSTA